MPNAINALGCERCLESDTFCYGFFTASPNARSPLGSGGPKQVRASKKLPRNSHRSPQFEETDAVSRTCFVASGCPAAEHAPSSLETEVASPLQIADAIRPRRARTRHLNNMTRVFGGEIWPNLLIRDRGRATPSAESALNAAAFVNEVQRHLRLREAAK